MNEIIINNRIFRYNEVERKNEFIDIVLKIEEFDYRWFVDLQHKMTHTNFILKHDAFGYPIDCILYNEAFKGEINFSPLGIFDKTLEIRIKKILIA